MRGLGTEPVARALRIGSPVMARALSGFFLLLLLCSAHAEDAAVEGSGAVGTIIFLVLFVGSCVGFFWLVWRNEKKAKQKREQLAGKDSGEAKHEA